METSVQLDDSTLGSFNERVRGTVLQPADDGYDEGLVIDRTPMNAVRVAPDAKSVPVQGGATWGELNHQLHAFDLEIVGMPYDEVGVGGFTLCGGMGMLSRKYGLAVDDLRSVDVVTSFDFDCHEDQPEALQSMFLHPIEDATDVIRFYREVIVDAPEAVVAGTGIFQIPADPAYLFELHCPGRSTDG